MRYVGLIKKGEKDPNEALNHPPNPDPATLTGQFMLAPLTVGPESTVDFSLAAVMNQLPLPLPYASLRIQYSGAPGSVIAQVSSVDERQDLVVDARTMNEGDGWAGSGANPWHLDANTQSILFLTDESDPPARIGFSITAGGVHYYLTSLKLAAHETRAIELAKLRDFQVADFKGHKIPAGATDGAVNWVRLDNVPVMGRVAVISKSGGMASSYDCCICICPANYDYLDVTPNAFSFLPADTEQLQSTAYDSDCNYQLYTYDETLYSQWSSGNTGVSTVNGSGLSTAVASGSTGISAAQSGPVYEVEGSYGDQYCVVAYYATQSDSGTANVCDFSIKPGSVTVPCDGSKQTTNFEALPSPSGCTICSSGSSCAATASGNIEISTGSPTFAVSGGVGYCTVSYFAGPPLQNGTAGAITVTITGAFCGTTLAERKSITVGVACQ